MGDSFVGFPQHPRGGFGGVTPPQSNKEASLASAPLVGLNYFSMFGFACLFSPENKQTDFVALFTLMYTNWGNIFANILEQKIFYFLVLF